jgi:hypothetical protein
MPGNTPQASAWMLCPDTLLRHRRRSCAEDDYELFQVVPTSKNGSLFFGTPPSRSKLIAEAFRCCVFSTGLKRTCAAPFVGFFECFRSPALAAILFKLIRVSSTLFDFSAGHGHSPSCALYDVLHRRFVRSFPVSLSGKSLYRENSTKAGID